MSKRRKERVRIPTNISRFFAEIRKEYVDFPRDREIAAWAGKDKAYYSSHMKMGYCPAEEEAEYRSLAKTLPGVVKVSVATLIADGLRANYPHIEFNIEELWCGRALKHKKSLLASGISLEGMS